MQPPTASPRDDLTNDQVVSLIQDAPAIVVGNGVELLTGMDLQIDQDISDDLSGGSVARNNLSTLHGTANLGITRELDWGNSILRPYMTMSDGSITARFNLGAYFVTTPGADVAETPTSFGVAGYDILYALNSLVGETYAVESGKGYLAAVEEILLGQGYVQYVIDQSAQSLVLPSTRVWPIDESTRWIDIVNSLLTSIGYRGVWSDWDGRVRCDAYLTPLTRAPEWEYVVDETRSMLTTSRTVERDLFDVPNRWVAIRSNDIDSAAPIEGAGIFTYVNESEGPTSIDARGGRIITSVLNFEAADQASLIAQTQMQIDADMTLPVTIKLGTSPNPLHWHFDRMRLSDPALGPITEVISNSWSLPLDGGDMTHEWNAL